MLSCFTQWKKSEYLVKLFVTFFSEYSFYKSVMAEKACRRLAKATKFSGHKWNSLLLLHCTLLNQYKLRNPIRILVLDVAYA